MSSVRGFVMSRWAVPLAGIVAMEVFAALFLLAPDVYFVLLRWLILLPAPRPFVDWEWLPSAVRCWTDGVDVWVNNTCYHIFPGSSFNYSPLWLRLSFLRTGEAWTTPFMLAVCGLFYWSIGVTPRQSSLWGQAATLLVAISSGAALAIERGNADLVIYLFFVAMLQAKRGPLPLRLAGYGLVIFAGLLKFYPFVALVIVLRERPAVVAMVAAASVAALAALGLAYHRELVLMLANLPKPSYFQLQMGARSLPEGLGATVAKITQHWRGADMPAALAAWRTTADLVFPTLVASAAAIGVVVARWCRLPSALRAMPAPEVDHLVVGAALIGGCFFMGQSVLYRGIYLLLALPGLMMLFRRLGGARGWVFGSVCGASVFVMWAPFIESVLFYFGLSPRLPYQQDILVFFPSEPARYALWLGGELAWWWIVTVLISVAGSFIVVSEAGTAAAARLGWRARPSVEPAT